MTTQDKPWRRPGAVSYALRRLPGLLRPPVSVSEPAANAVSVLKDLPVRTRDGTTLRVNVVLPADGGYRLTRQARDRPLRDEWWRTLVPALENITVPALICGSFSDNNLHARGSFRAFERISSADKFLYTHRDGKWATFYGPDARASQLGFFDRFLRGHDDIAAPPRVRLEVRESRDQIASVREEDGWPLGRTEWTSLYLTSDGLAATPPQAAGQMTFGKRSHGVRWDWTFPADTEITGPMALRLWVECHGCDDVDLFAGIEKWRGANHVPFEGSYGFGRDRVTTGWQKASLRALDERISRPFEPVPACTHRESLSAGQVVQADMALGPSATLFRAGETLRLVVAGRWLWPRNLLTGQFPAAYHSDPAGSCTLHWGPDQAARLLIPVIL